MPKNSPAESAKILAGDELVGFSEIKEASDFIKSNAGKEIEMKIKRNGEIFSVNIIPRLNPPEGEGAIGIAMDAVGTVKLPIHRAIIEGAIMTYNMIVGTAVSLFGFIVGAIKGTVGLSAISGPVGIAGIAGSAAKFGLFFF